ncbi:CPBP family intramembrane metalloprotease, partial [Muricauda sp. TY007]|uniref:CPBP family intramembrane glutamic endopeptidase n=1 Tax=Allomuricauda sp. TY007 TaxID=2683200 RepID=UPI0013C0E3CF
NNTIKALIVVGLVFGGVFEELFWRGYWIKRQVARYGKNAWIINAVLWSISHIIAYNPIKIIFIAFSFSFISNIYRTSTITVVFHSIINIFVGLRLITVYS